jgi:Peptidase family M1 domain
MRYLFILIGLVLLSACNVVTPTAPAPATPVPAASPTFTAPAVVATNAPATGAPAATLAPGLGQFDAALRPEFRGDLALVHAPTIYRLDLSLDPGLLGLSGQESVTYTNREQAPLSEIYFRLFANYPGDGGGTSVTNVRVNGAAVATTLEAQNTALRVPLARPLAPGASVSLSLNFGVSIPISNTAHYNDFVNADGIVTLPSAYALIPAYDANGWHIELPPSYGDLVYADSSFYDVRVTAPTTTTVIASGSAVEKTQTGNETTWHYIGAPMRDFDIDSSAVMQKASQQVGDVTVNSYYLPQDDASGQDVLQWASDALGVYEKRIGLYPFQELDVVETPTTAGGIEYPGVIAITSEEYRNANQQGALEFTVAHEVGHQWWYSVVGDDQVNTPWMDESLVQYTAYIYEEDEHGATAANFIRQRVFQDEYDNAKKKNEDLPVGLPVSAYTEDQYGEIVYGKGPLFFDAVRKQIGDDAFFKFLQTYYRRYKYQVATPDDMRQTLDEVSGQSIDALWNQWILGK